MINYEINTWAFTMYLFESTSSIRWHPTPIGTLKGICSRSIFLHFCAISTLLNAVSHHFYAGNIKLNGPCHINFPSFWVRVVENTFQRPEKNDLVRKTYVIGWLQTQTRFRFPLNNFRAHLQNKIFSLEDRQEKSVDEIFRSKNHQFSIKN